MEVSKVELPEDLLTPEEQAEVDAVDSASDPGRPGFKHCWLFVGCTWQWKGNSNTKTQEERRDEKGLWATLSNWFQRKNIVSAWQSPNAQVGCSRSSHFTSSHRCWQPHQFWCDRLGWSECLWNSHSNLGDHLWLAGTGWPPLVSGTVAASPQRGSHGLRPPMAAAGGAAGVVAGAQQLLRHGGVALHGDGGVFAAGGGGSGGTIERWLGDWLVLEVCLSLFFCLHSWSDFFLDTVVDGHDMYN